MLPPISGYLKVISAKNLVTGCKFWGIYLVATRYLCNMLHYIHSVMLDNLGNFPGEIFVI